MQIGGGTFAARGFTPFSQIKQPESVTAKGPGRDTLRIQLQRVDDEIGDLRAALTSIRSRGRKQRAPAVLGTVAGLHKIPTTAKLTSREEVNTEATSLSTRTPQWAGAGGRDVSISGVYAGTTDDTLTFTVAKGNGRTIDVTNSAGQDLGTYRLSNDPTRSNTFDLGNGLSVTFAPGADLAPSDSFSIDVKASQDGAIDPDDTFGGVGTASPRFEDGTTITNGSFSVNGVAITVGTGDTLNDVLSRISTLVDGVTARYDATTERVTLETDDPGTGKFIEITDDTSGLIAALKLDGLGRVTGTDGGGSAQTLDRTPGFEGVTAGTITINGTAIALDPSSQRLSDVLGLINDVEGVSAKLDPLGRVLIRGTAGETMTLADGGTGLAAALGLKQGLHQGRRGDKQTISDFAARRISSELMELRAALDALVDNEGLIGLVADMRTEIGVAVETSLRDAKGIDEIASLTRLNNFDNDRVASKTRTAHQMRRSYTDVRSLFLGSTSSRQEGLLDRLDDIVRGGLSKVDEVDVRV